MHYQVIVLHQQIQDSETRLQFCTDCECMNYSRLAHIWQCTFALKLRSTLALQSEDVALIQQEALKLYLKSKLTVMILTAPRLFKSGACTEALKLCSALSLESNDLPTHSARALAVQIGEGVLISEEISKRASRLLGGFCLGQLAAFPTLLAEDEEELERVEGGGMRKSRLADSLRFRITKKRILKAFVHAGSDGGN